jgi:hypothetical protein
MPGIDHQACFLFFIQPLPCRSSVALLKDFMCGASKSQRRFIESLNG